MTSLPHPRKLLFFAALSLADLSLTCLLLQGGGGRAYESNPVAAWWLSRFGWAGLAAFKLTLTVLVASLALAVSRRRPHAGGRVLAFGCSALLAVVLYSACLVSRVAADAESDRVEAAQLQQEWQRLDDIDSLLTDRIAAKQQLATEAAGGRRSLLDAAERFRELDRQSPRFDPEVLRLSTAGDTDEERYCRQVIRFVRAMLEAREDPDLTPLRRLEAELRDYLDGAFLLLSTN
jgi:hypothetical protein